MDALLRIGPGGDFVRTFGGRQGGRIVETDPGDSNRDESSGRRGLFGGLRRKKDVAEVSEGAARAGALLAAGALFLLAKGGPTPTVFAKVMPGHGDVEAVGGQLFTQGIVPFELATALLIAAAIGAIAIARGKAVRIDKPRALPKGKYFGGPAHPRDVAAQVDTGVRKDGAH